MDTCRGDIKQVLKLSGGIAFSFLFAEKEPDLLKYLSYSSFFGVVSSATCLAGMGCRATYFSRLQKYRVVPTKDLMHVNKLYGTFYRFNDVKSSF